QIPECDLGDAPCRARCASDDSGRSAALRIRQVVQVHDQCRVVVRKRRAADFCHALRIDQEYLARPAVPIGYECTESCEHDRECDAHKTSPFLNECGLSPPTQMKTAQVAG